MYQSNVDTSRLIRKEKFILTAAHCVDAGYENYIRAASPKSNEGRKTFELNDIIFHSDNNKNHDFTRRAGSS